MYFNITQNRDLAAAARKHALECFPEQAVGLVVYAKQDGIRYEYLPLENSSRNPETQFLVVGCPQVETVAVIHSRTHTTSNAPGLRDMKQQQEMGIPWAVHSCNGTCCSELQWFGDQLPIPPLLGRRFVSGYTDCWCLIRDVYRQQFDIVLENVPRDEDWCLGPEPFDHFSEDNIERTGFEIISKDDARPGDVLLGRVRSKVNNHCALLLENGYVLQQFAGENFRSRRESIAHWGKLVTYVGRHKKFVDNPDSIPEIRVDE